MTLKTQLEELSRSFAAQVVDAIRNASLHELSGTGAEATGRRGGRAAMSEGARAASVSPPPKTTGKSGRLRRRSAEEIAKMLDKIVLLVKTHKNGLRAEEIRAKLGMQAKEMPRILKEGLAKKKLTSKGQKRATTYLAR